MHASMGSLREVRRLLRLVKLAIVMDASNLIDEGVPRKKLPMIRRRFE